MRTKVLSILLLMAVLNTNVHAIRTGKSVIVNPSDMNVNTNVVLTQVYSSVWNVYYTSLTPLYSAFTATTSPCYIARTGNTYTIKVGAFGRVFTYIQPSTGELNLTKTETINTSNTSRRNITWVFTTNGINASLQCSVQVETLTKNVWKITTPATIWLKSYTSVANMQTIL